MQGISNKTAIHSLKRGFSLVELSIVLVILGLLVGGVLSGQSLIRAAELRSVSTDVARYQAAIQAFRDKYFALPGDMASATQFWGAANTAGTGGQCADILANAGTGTQTCNGSGNGTVDRNEGYRFWQHLANAGLIEGSYSGTGVIDATPYPVPVLGTNVPKSKLGQAAWGVYNISNFSINGFDGVGLFQAKLFLGAGRMYGTDWPNYPLRTEEAWNLDTKMDDGRPGMGMMQVQLDGSGSTGSGCMSTAVSTTSDYVLTNTGFRCSPSFKILP